MKCAILLAIVAFSNASPLFGTYGVDYPTGGLWGYQQAQIEPINRYGFSKNTICDQLRRIKDLQWRVEQNPSQLFDSEFHHGLDTSNYHPYVHQMCGEEAASVFHQLNNHQHYFGVGTYTPTGFTTDNAHFQVGGVANGVNTETIHKLADEHEKTSIEMEINHHQHSAQQLKQQQQFVDQQKHEIQNQLASGGHFGATKQVYNLKQLHENLHQQECQLIKEQLSHHIAALELQIALIHKDVQLLDDTVQEHEVQRITAGSDFSTRNWSV
ncbi:hypothetical protein HUJ04_001879 [Dendroctonus ponderosae]